MGFNRLDSAILLKEIILEWIILNEVILGASNLRLLQATLLLVVDVDCNRLLLLACRALVLDDHWLDHFLGFLLLRERTLVSLGGWHMVLRIERLGCLVYVDQWLLLLLWLHEAEARIGLDHGAWSAECHGIGEKG